MRRLLCRLGIHHWEHHVNRGVSGPDAGFDLCSHCGREKKRYEERGNPAAKGPLIG